MPASAHGDLELVRPCEIESGRDIAGADAARDHRRPAVDERVEAAARCVVLGVRGADDGAGQRTPQLVQVLVVDACREGYVAFDAVLEMGNPGRPEDVGALQR